MADNRSPEEIKADIEAQRAQLTQSVNELVDKVHPRNQINAAKQGARDAVNSVGDSVKDFGGEVQKGEPKALAVVGAGAAVLGLVVFAAVRKARN